MINPPLATIARAYCQTHQRLLAIADKLSDAQLSWRQTPTSHSIVFHLWHLARWADHLQAAIPGMTLELGRRLGPAVQVWEAQELAARWGFDSTTLGYAQTGMEMDSDTAVHLRFPGKTVVLQYIHQAFDAADRAVLAIDEQQFLEKEQPQPMTQGVWEAGATVGDAIVEHLTHENRHLGMIECLYGFQVHSGTATV